MKCIIKIDSKRYVKDIKVDEEKEIVFLIQTIEKEDSYIFESGQVAEDVAKIIKGEFETLNLQIIAI